jgi:hypothetical protein
MKKNEKITAACILAKTFSIPLKYPKRSASADIFIHSIDDAIGAS